MRRVLDRLYALSGALAAISLVVILAIVLVQVAFNVVDKIAAWVTGSAIGLMIPSYSTIAGFFLVGATFFALAWTFNAGGHIRVTLTLNPLPPGFRRVAEIWASGAASALSAVFVWFAVQLTYQSWRFGDTSTGLVPIPIWVPQAVMTLGAAVLLIACLDGFVQNLAGRKPAYLVAEQAVDVELKHSE
ncbi:MAG: TRAP transporter small permease [Gammaproteobacteria bacterium]